MQLTINQIVARVAVYDELIAHLDQEIYDNEHEQEQGRFLQNQIIRAMDRFVFMYRNEIENYHKTAK